MSAARTSARLVRLYPPAWRARYGEELEALIVETSGGQRVPWRTRANVALGAARQQLHRAGLSGDRPPAERVRGGALLTLCAWALFTVAGLAVQKLSEHWQDATPAASRAVPSTAFDVLVVAAAWGTALVLIGAGAALPSLLEYLRDGGWPAIRRHIVAAAVATAVAFAATVALVAWAHGLTGRARNGHDLAYSVAFVTWAALIVVSLALWTLAAVAAAARLRLPTAALRTVAWLACGVAAAMAAMTAATLAWWAGATPPGLALQLALVGALMLIATVLGATGARRAMRALPALAN